MSLILLARPPLYNGFTSRISSTHEFTRTYLCTLNAVSLGNVLPRTISIVSSHVYSYPSTLYLGSCTEFPKFSLVASEQVFLCVYIYIFIRDSCKSVHECELIPRDSAYYRVACVRRRRRRPIDTRIILPPPGDGTPSVAATLPRERCRS